MNKFRDLHVYGLAIELCTLIRKTVNSLPREERYDLGSQLRRAGNSIALNIAEGAGDESNAEFTRFLRYAIRSAFECLACFDIALDGELISKETFKDLDLRTNRIIAMLYGLQKSLKNSRKKSSSTQK